MAGRLKSPVRRRPALLLLAAGIGALHLVLASVVGERLVAWQAAAAVPPRLQAAFVR